MPKRTIYSAEELLYMDKEELIRIHNREAERHNKQVTRAKGRGVSAGLTGKRVSPLSKNSRMSVEDITERLLNLYDRADLTLTGMLNDIADVFGNDSKEFKRDLKRKLKEDPNKGFEIARDYADTMQQIKRGKKRSWRAVYYEALVRAVESHEIESFAHVDRVGTDFDYQADQGPSLDDISAIFSRL